MEATQVVFLEDMRARQLAVAWETCKGDREQWLTTAGLLPTPQVLRFCEMLIRNEICKDDGTTQPLAMQYITRLATKTLGLKA